MCAPLSHAVHLCPYNIGAGPNHVSPSSPPYVVPSGAPLSHEVQVVTPLLWLSLTALHLRLLVHLYLYLQPCIKVLAQSLWVKMLKDVLQAPFVVQVVFLPLYLAYTSSFFPQPPHHLKPWLAVWL